MGAMSGAAMVDELQRRLTNLGDTAALAALNRAQRWAIGNGSYQFMLAAPVTITIAQQASIAAQNSDQTALQFDPGKAKMMFNTDGSPIMHVPWSDFWMSLNYNLPASSMYDQYTVRTVNTGAGTVQHTFYFLPNVAGVARFFFHRLTGEITDSSLSYSDLPTDFDDLLIDLAEAEERRVYDIGDQWQILLGRAQERIKLLLAGYRSETMQPTDLQDAQTKQTESAQLGRA